MEKKDLLNAEIQLLSIISFLFVSSCAGFGFLITLVDFGNSLILQCLSTIIGIFAISVFVWGVLVTTTILKLKN